MKPLYNLNGDHIACDYNSNLYSLSGSLKGYFNEHFNIYIDLQGKYLGEIFNNNRLVYRKKHNFDYSFNYFPEVDFQINSCQNLGNIGSIGEINEFKNPIL